MNTTLSENRHIEQNYQKNDDFDFFAKGEAIRVFLEYNVTDLLSNKMLALYGNWGTGKTSLMHCIAERVDKDLYYPVFFEAWQFEKDENLPMSLCDLLTFELETEHSSLVKNFREKALLVMKGFASGLNIKIGSSFIGAEVEFNGKDALEVLKPVPENKSAFVINEEFKVLYRQVEDALLEKSNAQRIVIFIDDLDRCEPEHVLNLITALKLFFTYGEKSIFFCGLDKDAVTNAVVSKYQDVVKSEEYLEKVFDISFQMPKSFSLKKLLQRHYSGETLYSMKGLDNVDLVNQFFKAIKFTNPRHIKKVLNKYQILRSFKSNAELQPSLKILIPMLLDSNGTGDVFETIFCLFFIILYEFHPEQFTEIEDYERKLKKYVQPIWQTVREQSATASMHSITGSLSAIQVANIEDAGMPVILSAGGGNAKFVFVRLIFILTPASPDRLSILYDTKLDEFGDYFQDDSKLTLFCKFLIGYQNEILDHQFSDYIFWNYFRMCTHLL